MLAALFAATASAQPLDGRVESGPSATPRTSVALRDLPLRLGTPPYFVSEKAADRINPRADEPDQGRRGTWHRKVVEPDPLAAHGLATGRRSPDPLLEFAGASNTCGCLPPDTVGDVGPHNYVQIVNATTVTVFDKSGATVAGPLDLSSLWSSGACIGDDGDPVVSYDPLADRWLLAQFATPKQLCFAVSQTADPAGVYNVYTFATSQFPDYFKVGVWSDGYFVSTNENDYNAWVFERAKMLQGLAAGSQKANAASDNFLLPPDVDGLAAPPAGEDAIFYTFLDGAFHGGTDRLELRAFHVDWANAANSSFAVVASPALAAFTYTACGFFQLSCAPQSGTTAKLDVVSEWPMFRFAYRNLGDHESLVGNFTVGVGPAPARAAPRWFELRRTGGAWSLHQEGTYDPTAIFRFMGSIAQDHYGNAALGYTATSSSDFPAIRYASRLAGDAPGTLGSEVTLQPGGGAQTSGSSRWGDYSAMSIDPSDDCTFWYTNEYYSATASSAWKTRIGAFRLPECDVLFLDDFETGGSTRWSQTEP